MSEAKVEREYVFDDESQAKTQAAEYAKEDSTEEKAAKWGVYTVDGRTVGKPVSFVVAKSANQSLLKWNDKYEALSVNKIRAVKLPEPAEYIDCITASQFDELCELIKSKG